MKLRKIFATAAMALLVGAGAAAQNPTIEDVRIYINPGHGAFDSGSRPMGTVKHGANNAYTDVNNDTANFFESNTNLQKAFGLMEKLISYGVPFDRTKNQTNDNPHRVGAALDMTQNIVFSRVKSGATPAYIDYENNVYNPESDYYDRALSEVAAEVEFNDFDMFISIHSNALNEGTSTNYPLILYRGTDSQEGNAGSIAMGKAVWPHLFGMGHHQWTYYSLTKMNLRGDHSFYGGTSTVKYKVPEGYVFDETDNFSEYIAATDSTPAYVKYTGYLGVIKHGVPGFLSEGYFHTYQPARHRYMNWDVCHLEGVAYARGIADYFGWDVATKETKGTIYGIVRDLHEKFTHEFYTPNAGTNDKFKPLNGVTVSLKKDGTEVATYTTDDEWNGAFVFNVEPGTYTIECTHPDYKAEQYSEATAKATPSVITVTVDAAKCVYPEVFLESTTYEPPKVVYVNYPDSTAGKADFKLAPYYEVKAKDYTLLAEQLADKKVRRQILRDDKLYVLALDEANEPYIYLADFAAGTVTELDKAAVVMGGNGILKVSDIALTADHVLVASGYSQNHASDDIASGDGVDRGTVNFYKWSQDSITALPDSCELWFTSNTSVMFNRGNIGKTLAYSGTIENGTLTASCHNGSSSSSIGMRFNQFAIAESQMVGETILDSWDAVPNEENFYPDNISSNADNWDYEIMVSPLGNNNNFVLDGDLIAPFEWSTDGNEVAYAGVAAKLIGRNEAVSSVKANGANYFKYAGKALMVAPSVNEEGKVAGLELYDITNGLDNAVEISLNGAALAEPVEYTYASAHGELALELSSDDKTIGADIELFLIVDGKVTKFEAGDFYTTAKLAKNEITGTANPFAYALSSEIADGALKVKYSLNTDATAVAVNIKNEEGEVVVTATGATTKGAQTVDVNIAELIDGKYSWEVAVDGDVKANIERFSSENFYHPSGLDIDNSFESGSFGTRFVCEGYNRGQKSGYVSAHADGRFGGGLYIFDPQGNQILNKDGEARFYPSWLTNTDRTFGSKTCGADFGKVAIADDGRIFVNRYNFEGDYYLYAESLEKLVADGEFTSLLAGKTMTDGIYFDEAGSYLAGPAQSFDVKGSGDDLKLLALSRADNSVNTGTGLNRVVEYELGTGKELSTPTSHVALDQKYTISYDRKSNIQYDNRGGVWYIQYRSEPTNDVPALVYVDENGEIKYFEGAGGNSRYQGSLSVAPDGNSIVASSASGIVSVYEIIRAEDGAVFLNETYRLTHNMGGSAYSAAWDIAGNFYLGNASNEVVQGYALPRAEAAVTKAARKYGFSVTDGGIIGIDEIEAEDANAPVEYYNLQGVKVANPEKGIFIKKQGSKATKVIL